VRLCRVYLPWKGIIPEDLSVQASIKMPKLLFVNKDAQSSILSGPVDRRERFIINSHVQAQRKQSRKDRALIKLNSERPKFLEFRRKDDVEVINGYLTPPASDGSVDLDSSSSHDEDDEEPQNQSQEKDKKLCLPTYSFYDDDWTANMTPFGTQNLIDVRQHSESRRLVTRKSANSFLIYFLSALFLLSERCTALHHTIGQPTPGSID
jgi:hypothetical protein